MLLAQAEDGTRIEPKPGVRAACPQCGSEVLAKCGTLVTWHWAHRKVECDTWSEGETDWHLGWKRQVVVHACEVVIGDHRADIRTPSGMVVELQHSLIDARRIEERETFYGRIAWLFDARAFELEVYPRGATLDFEWRRPKKSLLAVKSPMYWDLGRGFVMKITSLRRDRDEAGFRGFRGNGTLLDAACFASSLFGGAARPDVHVAAQSRARRVAACARLTQVILQEDPSAGVAAAFTGALERLAEDMI